MPGERISLSALGQQLRKYKETSLVPAERPDPKVQAFDALRAKEAHKDAYFWSQGTVGQEITVEGVRWINPDVIEATAQGCFIYLCLNWSREQAKLGRPIQRLGEISNLQPGQRICVWDPLWLNDRVALVKRFSLK